jgi:hypothetical protein
VSDIFNEVDEDLRRDRAERLWKEYGNYVIAGAVAIVLATAGWVAWNDYDRRQAAADGQRFFAAIDRVAADPTAAGGEFAALARDARPGYRALSRFYEAGLKARAGDLAAAHGTYRALAADTSVSSELRDAATVLAALVSLDTLGAGEVEALLGKLSGGDSPWRFSALEIGAVAALKAGDVAKAKTLYARVADDTAAPQSLRARAAEMLQAIGG